MEELLLNDDDTTNSDNENDESEDSDIEISDVEWLLWLQNEATYKTRLLHYIQN